MPGQHWAVGTTAWWCTLDSPVGELLLLGDELGLAGLDMVRRRPDPDIAVGWRHDAARFREAAAQLNAYFAGELTAFTVPLSLHGTRFQLRVWQALQAIPYGTTVSYGWLASGLGMPRGSRAVGLANGRNPVPVIVPCHRVVGADGALTGYGSGLGRKRFLLELEARTLW
jgi:methylated-DNA-[protein]-cysteine S-methyltransferase